MLTTLPPGIGVLAASENSTPSSIFQKVPPLGLGATISDSFSTQSPLFPWVRWYYDHHRGTGLVPQVCGWSNWCRTCVSPWSTSPIVILNVSASGYLPHLPFGYIGPLGLHDSGCTLELHLRPHWLALELLVGYRHVDENLAQLHFVMWMVALLAQGGHAVPLSILTGELTHLLVFFDGFRGWFYSRWLPHILLFSWRGICCECLQVYNSFFVIFVFPSLVCLNYLESISLSSVCLNFSGIARILFSCILTRIKFAVIFF